MNKLTRKQIITEIKAHYKEAAKYREQLKPVSDKVEIHKSVQARLSKGEEQKLRHALSKAKVELTVEPTKANQAICDDLAKEIEFLNNPDHYSDMTALIGKRDQLISLANNHTIKAQLLKLQLVDSIDIPKGEILKSFAAFTYKNSRGGAMVSNWVEIKLAEWLFEGKGWGASLQPEWDAIQASIELKIKEG